MKPVARSASPLEAPRRILLPDGRMSGSTDWSAACLVLRCQAAAAAPMNEVAGQARGLVINLSNVGSRTGECRHARRCCYFRCQTPDPLVGTRRRTRARGLTWRPEQSRAEPSRPGIRCRHDTKPGGTFKNITITVEQGQPTAVPTKRNETKRSAAAFVSLADVAVRAEGLSQSQNHRGPERSNVPFNVLRRTWPPVPGNGRRRRIGRRRTCLETALCHG